MSLYPGRPWDNVACRQRLECQSLGQLSWTHFWVRRAPDSGCWSLEAQPVGREPLIQAQSALHTDFHPFTHTFFITLPSSPTERYLTSE